MLSVAETVEPPVHPDAEAGAAGLFRVDRSRHGSILDAGIGTCGAEIDLVTGPPDVPSADRGPVGQDQRGILKTERGGEFLRDAVGIENVKLSGQFERDRRTGRS